MTNTKTLLFNVRVMSDGSVEVQPGHDGFGPAVADQMVAAVVAVRKALEDNRV